MSYSDIYPIPKVVIQWQLSYTDGNPTRLSYTDTCHARRLSSLTDVLRWQLSSVSQSGVIWPPGATGKLKGVTGENLKKGRGAGTCSEGNRKSKWIIPSILSHSVNTVNTITCGQYCQYSHMRSILSIQSHAVNSVNIVTCGQYCHMRSVLSHAVNTVNTVNTITCGK